MLLRFSRGTGLVRTDIWKAWSYSQDPAGNHLQLKTSYPLLFQYSSVRSVLVLTQKVKGEVSLGIPVSCSRCCAAASIRSKRSSSSICTQRIANPLPLRESSNGMTDTQAGSQCFMASKSSGSGSYPKAWKQLARGFFLCFCLWHGQSESQLLR